METVATSQVRRAGVCVCVRADAETTTTRTPALFETQLRSSSAYADPPWPPCPTIRLPFLSMSSPGQAITASPSAFLAYLHVLTALASGDKGARSMYLQVCVCWHAAGHGVKAYQKRAAQRELPEDVGSLQDSQDTCMPAVPPPSCVATTASPW